MTIVLIRKSLVSAVSRVETSEKGIGLLGFGVRVTAQDLICRLINVGQQGCKSYFMVKKAFPLTGRELLSD